MFWKIARLGAQGGHGSFDAGDVLLCAARRAPTDNHGDDDGDDDENL